MRRANTRENVSIAFPAIVCLHRQLSLVEVYRRRKPDTSLNRLQIRYQSAFPQILRVFECWAPKIVDSSTSCALRTIAGNAARLLNPTCSLLDSALQLIRATVVGSRVQAPRRGRKASAKMDNPISRGRFRTAFPIASTFSRCQRPDPS